MMTLPQLVKRFEGCLKQTRHSVSFLRLFLWHFDFLDSGAVKTDREVEWEREGLTCSQSGLNWQSTFSILLLANKTIVIKPLATPPPPKNPPKNQKKPKALVIDQFKQTSITFFFSSFPTSVRHAFTWKLTGHKSTITCATENKITAPKCMLCLCILLTIGGFPVILSNCLFKPPCVIEVGVPVLSYVVQEDFGWVVHHLQELSSLLFTAAPSLGIGFRFSNKLETYISENKFTVCREVVSWTVLGSFSYTQKSSWNPHKDSCPEYRIHCYCSVESTSA